MIIVLCAAAVGLALAISVRNTAAPSPSRQTAATASPTNTRPAAGSGAASRSQLYQTVGADVRIRAAATTESTVIFDLQSQGSSVTLYCYQAGQAILGDQFWYQASAGAVHGYIAGYWINTGPDPAATELPAC